MSALRPVLVLIAAVWFLQLGGGALSVIVPLALSNMGAATSQIGMIAALYAFGMMAGAYIAPKLVARIGNIRVFSAAATLSVIGSLILSFEPALWSWSLIRIVQGVGFAAMFTSAEAWLGQAAPKDQRGSILGAYNVAAKAALMTGPFLVASITPLTPYGFILTALFLASALIPVCLTQQIEPERIAQPKLPLIEISRAAPAALFGCFMAGMINTGTFAFLPLFATNTLGDLGATIGPTAIAAMAFATANAGGLIAQWPVGRLSDQFDRRSVVAVQCIFSALIVFTLAFTSDALPDMIILVMLAFWGAGSLTFYGICVAHGIDRVRDDQVTGLIGVVIICWATGSVLGPIIAGLAVGPDVAGRGLFLFAGAGLSLLAVTMVVRRLHRISVARTSRWYPALPGAVGLIGTRLQRVRKSKPNK